MQHDKTIRTVTPQDGENFSVVGDTYRLMTTGEQTNHAYSLIDMLIPPGGGPGPHAHADIQEAFYILDGEIEVTTEAQKYTAKAGSLVNIPYGGLVHMFTNKTNTIARMLCLTTPSGIEEMFKEIGKPVTAGTILPKPEMKPAEIEKFKAIAEKHGQKLYPPDYFKK